MLGYMPEPTVAVPTQRESVLYAAGIAGVGQLIGMH
jgi:hypothetical protein